MRILFIFIFGLCYGIASGQRNIPKYEIQDQRLLNVLTKLADTIKMIDNGKWVMEVHFDKAFTKVVHPQTILAPGAVEFDLKKPSLKIDLDFFALATPGIRFAPTAYTEINNVPCLLFTGIEPLILDNAQKRIRKLRRKLKKRLVGVVEISYAWKVKLKDDSFTIESRHIER